MSRPPNVILISADALRADHTSFHGYERQTTPFLSSFASECAMFRNCYSASSHTREAVPALLTGRHPHIFAEAGYTLTTDSVAGHLSKAGYTTGGFHSNPYVSRAYGFEEGFDMFYDDLLFGQNKIFALAQRALDKFVFKKGEYHARASEINDRSLDWIDSLGDEPFFLWNHYMDPHGPYNPPSEFNKYIDQSLSNSKAQELYQKCINNPETISKSERKLLIDLYDGEIKYLDSQLQSFIESLKDRNLMEDTLVIFTADHGDAFGEHGYYTHPRRLDDELIHVPLLISKSDVNPQIIDQPVSTLDIVSSILDFCDQDYSELDGNSLFQDRHIHTEDHPCYAFSSAQGEGEDESTRRFSIRTKGWAYFIDRDIETGEITNSYTEEEGKCNKTSSSSTFPIEIKNMLHDHSAKCIPTSVSSHKDDRTNQQVESRLESLGYK